MRLDKYLADMSVGTRSDIKKNIRAGLVSVDGNVIKDPGFKVDEGASVTFQGRSVSFEKLQYFMLYKPAGVISATEDKNQKTVIDLLGEEKRKDLFPVGRLDKDTEGLLLITNDGDLAHRLLSPTKHVDKCYFAKVSGIVDEDDIKAIAEGIDIGTDEKPEITRPAKLELINVTKDLDAGDSLRDEELKDDHSEQYQSEYSEYSEVYITIHEGKYHEIKRMFQKVGKEVLYLKRLTMGTLTLDESLQPGEYRRLTEEELRDLMK